MNNIPQIEMWGGCDGDKKGIEIKGNGCNLYGGSVNVNIHGVKMSGVGIKNDEGSTAIISDIETDSQIINMGGSFLNLERAKIFIKSEKIKLLDNVFVRAISLLSSVAGLVTFIYWLFA
ncbi:MAG: hypothetical protein IPN70_02930 [Candidatus Moraniibacteriota bacterium]|nr:MAG: hypothetical protein IPN70_02930 [Candidatus Moranbacteria bacterium]